MSVFMAYMLAVNLNPQYIVRIPLNKINQPIKCMREGSQVEWKPWAFEV